MDFNEHYDFMTQIEESKNIKDEKNCCEIKDNYQIDQGIIKCKICSNTISNITDGPEWRYYGTSDTKGVDPTRCGMPVNTLLPESSVGSSISYGRNTKTMNQIRKYQQWGGMPYKERSLYKVFLEIQRCCKENDLPPIIINEAKSIYTIVSSTKISRGANREGIIAACVYFACKGCNVPRSSKEVAEIFNINGTVMTKGVKKCQEIIHMNKKNKKRLTNNKSIKPEHFIDRFCNKLKMEENDVHTISEICKESLKNNIISENTPPSIAAGCIFYYIKKKEMDISKKDISDICIISEVTINKCCKKLEMNDKLFCEILKNKKD
tara:strand:+ start:228 stop:1193 length:966 start_codon:yes stop_codon:yes gene_type:complete